MPLLTVSPPPQIAMPDLNDFVTTKEAAELLDLHVKSIQHMVRKQTLSGIKIGRDWLISKDSINDYLEKTKGLAKNDPRRNLQDT